MICHPEGKAGLRNRCAALRQPAEGMEGALVNVMAINPEQGFAVITTQNFVRDPQFID